MKRAKAIVDRMNRVVVDRTPGVIRADESYTQPEFCRRAGLARKAYAAARRHGLLVIEFGKKRWIRGADWLAFLARQAEQQAARS